jgi:hypothetical protein
MSEVKLEVDTENVTIIIPSRVNDVNMAQLYSPQTFKTLNISDDVTITTIQYIAQIGGYVQSREELTPAFKRFVEILEDNPVSQNLGLVKPPIPTTTSVGAVGEISTDTAPTIPYANETYVSAISPIGNTINPSATTTTTAEMPQEGVTAPVGPIGVSSVSTTPSNSETTNTAATDASFNTLRIEIERSNAEDDTFAGSNYAQSKGHVFPARSSLESFPGTTLTYPELEAVALDVYAQLMLFYTDFGVAVDAIDPKDIYRINGKYVYIAPKHTFSIKKNAVGILMPSAAVRGFVLREIGDNIAHISGTRLHRL